MSLTQTDLDAAARCLCRAQELLDRSPSIRALAVQDSLRASVRRLVRGDPSMADPGSWVALQAVADQTDVTDARAEIIKALTTLRGN